MTKAKKYICIKKMQTNTDEAFRCWQYRLGYVWVPELVESPLQDKGVSVKREESKNL